MTFKSAVDRFRSHGERLRLFVSAHPPLLVTFVGLMAVAAWGFAGWGAWLSFDVTRAIPDKGTIGRIGNMARATTLLDVNDKPVFTIFKEQRIEVPLSRVSPNLVRAVVAVEDQRFFDHRGIDLRRLVAAVLVNLRERRWAQGGSTITQQLARLSLLTPRKALRRKMQEIVLAAEIERAYSKQEILELYLNKVYFGEGFHGAEAAALGFFGKHASDLSIAEASLLAGLIQAPSTYAPTNNLQRAVTRQAVVLQAMRDTGAIDAATFEQAKREPIHLQNGLDRQEEFGQYFKEQVRRELVEKFGWDRVSEGGLRVYTTIDPKMQEAAETYVEQELIKIENRRGYKHPRRGEPEATIRGNISDYLQAAVVALDPMNGEVRVMVGGRDFNESKFNRAVQAYRQPGSAFKPFIYAAAIEAGYSPATVIHDLDNPIWTPQGDYSPEDEHSGASSMSLRTALRTSSNRAAVHLLQEVGIKRTVDYAKRLRVGNVPSVPSLALGAGEVTVQSMTGAFAAFSNGGMVYTPHLIRRVEDSEGQILFEERDTGTRAITEQTAFLMANMLADVVNAGTGYRARAEGFVLPAAGKTGTTNDFNDAWFVGFTPKLVAGVWVGFDRPQTIISNGFAGDLAVPLWAKFMKVATAGDKPTWMTVPKGIVAVEVCRVSGLRPTEGCQNVLVTSESGASEMRSTIYTEYFAAGTEPTEFCSEHNTSLWDRISATSGTVHEPPPPVVAPPAVVVETPQAAIAIEEPRPEPAAAEQPPPKRRGFWSRVFGRREKRDDPQQTQPDPPRRQ